MTGPLRRSCRGAAVYVQGGRLGPDGNDGGTGAASAPDTVEHSRRGEQIVDEEERCAVDPSRQWGARRVADNNLDVVPTGLGRPSLDARAAGVSLSSMPVTRPVGPTARTR